MVETVWFKNDETNAEYHVEVGSAAYNNMHKRAGFTPIDGPTVDEVKEPEKTEKPLNEMSYDELKHKAIELGLDGKGKKDELLAAIQAKLAEVVE